MVRLSVLSSWIFDQIK